MKKKNKKTMKKLIFQKIPSSQPRTTMTMTLTSMTTPTSNKKNSNNKMFQDKTFKLKQSKMKMKLKMKIKTKIKIKSKKRNKSLQQSLTEQDQAGQTDPNQDMIQAKRTKDMMTLKNSQEITPTSN